MVKHVMCKNELTLCKPRPDIAYEVTELSTCFKKAIVRNLKEVSKCIKTVKSGKKERGVSEVKACSWLEDYDLPK